MHRNLDLELRLTVCRPTLTCHDGRRDPGLPGARGGRHRRRRGLRGPGARRQGGLRPPQPARRAGPGPGHRRHHLLPAGRRRRDPAPLPRPGRAPLPARRARALRRLRLPARGDRGPATAEGLPHRRATGAAGRPRAAGRVEVEPVPGDTCGAGLPHPGAGRRGRPRRGGVPAPPLPPARVRPATAPSPARPSTATGALAASCGPAPPSSRSRREPIRPRRWSRSRRGAAPPRACPTSATGVGVVVGGKVRRPPGAVHAVVGGRTYRISPGVFWQVHTGAATALLVGGPGLRRAVRGGIGGRPLRRRRPLLRRRWPTQSGRRAPSWPSSGTGAPAPTPGTTAPPSPTLRVLEGEVTPALVESALGRPDIVVLDPAREGAGTDVMRALAAHAPDVRTAGLRLVRPVVLRARHPRPARRGLAPRRAARLRHLPHDRARRAGGGAGAARRGSGDRRSGVRRARRARARCARATRTAGSSAPRRSGPTGTPADGRAPVPPRPS